MRLADDARGLKLRPVPSVESAAVAALQSLYDEVFADLDAADGGANRRLYALRMMDHAFHYGWGLLRVDS